MSGTADGNGQSVPADRPALPTEIAELTDPSNREDPYPALAKLRDRSPYAPFDGLIVVGRHADVSALLRDQALSAARDRSPLSRTPQGPRTRNFLNLDPPEHTRYRRLVSGAFARRRVERLAPRIREIVTELLQEAEGPGTFDIAEGLAHPLPLQVICELLGVPYEDRPRLQYWSSTITGMLDPPFGPPPVKIAGMARARADFVNYFRDLIEERRKAPRDDLISHLITIEEDGERLDDSDVLSTCVVLLNAGHETTVNLVGNSVLALMRHPDQFARLRDDLSLAGAVVEEVLRYDAPVQMTARIVREACRIGDTDAKPGDTVLLLLSAANRDPDVYPEPDRFDIDRKPAASHLSFAAGAHFCLGAGLARLEVTIALELFCTMLGAPRLRPDGLSYKPNLNVRGPSRLLLDIDGVRAA